MALPTFAIGLRKMLVGTICPQMQKMLQVQDVSQANVDTALCSVAIKAELICCIPSGVLMLRKTSIATCISSFALSLVVELLTKIATVLVLMASSRGCDSDVYIRRKRNMEKVVAYGFVGDKCVFAIAPVFACLLFTPGDEKECAIAAGIGMMCLVAETSIDTLCIAGLAGLDIHVLRCKPSATARWIGVISMHCVIHLNLLKICELHFGS